MSNKNYYLDGVKMKAKLLSVIAVVLILITAVSVVPASAANYKSLPRNYNFHYGIDVSKWNDSLNMKQILDCGVDFGYIRIGTYDKSGGHLDSRFKENVKKFVENGIEFGVYVYSYVYKASDNVKCAKWVVKQLNKMGYYTKDKENIQVAYDIEDTVQVNAIKKKKVTRAYMHKSVMKFCNTVKKYNYSPVVYSFESFFYDFLNVDDFQKNNVKIWWARWPKPLNTKKKYVLKNGTNPDVWQFASTYKIGSGVFDTNVCYEDFYDYSKESSTLTVKGLKNSYSLKSSKVKPSFKVYDGKTLLKKNVDYKVVYFANNRSGTAKAKIIRYKNGEYFETKTVLFTIKPTPVKILSKISTVDEIEFTWNKVANATKYQIFEYDYDYKVYDKIDTVKSTEYLHFDLEPNTTYKMKIRPVYKNNGKTTYGNATSFSIKTKKK